MPQPCWADAAGLHQQNALAAFPVCAQPALLYTISTSYGEGTSLTIPYITLPRRCLGRVAMPRHGVRQPEVNLPDVWHGQSSCESQTCQRPASPDGI